MTIAWNVSLQETTTIVGGGDSSYDGTGTNVNLNYPVGLTISNDGSVLYLGTRVCVRARRVAELI